QSPQSRPPGDCEGRPDATLARGCAARLAIPRSDRGGARPLLLVGNFLGSPNVACAATWASTELKYQHGGAPGWQEAYFESSQEERLVPGILDKERIIAPSSFNRWLIPPCALATHLCIGQAYALSVFNLPLTRQLGISKSVSGDWTLAELGWIFSIAIVMLGLSAALFGTWVQREGPRKSGFVAALCWGVGFLVGALGISTHQLWLVYLGYGFIGGIGLGIGYITPVSTLISWFPDRRGMATGMAIMGFGGGALIASPLSDSLMKAFSSPTSTGVAQTWVVLGIVYFIFMMGGAFGYRLPAPG